MGKPTEFRKYSEIVAAFGPGGPTELPTPALITDDTQMALAVALALRDSAHTPESLTSALTANFVEWHVSPENNRAPGRTCMFACAALARGVRWQEASVMGSKGCGANMRVTPVGLITGPDVDTMAGIAQLQAGLTHGHPTGLAAAELTALAVRLLREGSPLSHVPRQLRDRCDTQREVYREEWLGDLWQSSLASSAVGYISLGWDECARALDRLIAALEQPDDGDDVCKLTGGGWIAEEALATALHAALRHPGDSVAAIGRAAATSGDSDSIACLAGAFHGAAFGMEVWPVSWVERIEHSSTLAALGALWD